MLSRVACVAALAALLSLPGLAASAADAPIAIEKPWARATTGKTGAVYLTLANKGAAPDRLVGAASPVADKAMVHESKMTNGVMQMRPVGPLELAPGATVTLQPGGYHIMLTGLKEPLKVGSSFPLTLSFEHAGEVAITVAVEKAGAMPSHTGHSMDGMKMN
jgi:copper(I)-binding protein